MPKQRKPSPPHPKTKLHFIMTEKEVVAETAHSVHRFGREERKEVRRQVVNANETCLVRSSLQQLTSATIVDRTTRAESAQPTVELLRLAGCCKQSSKQVITHIWTIVISPDDPIHIHSWREEMANPEGRGPRRSDVGWRGHVADLEGQQASQLPTAGSAGAGSGIVDDKYFSWELCLPPDAFKGCGKRLIPLVGRQDDTKTGAAVRSFPMTHLVLHCHLGAPEFGFYAGSTRCCLKSRQN
jgi:hypothetical protein